MNPAINNFSSIMTGKLNDFALQLDNLKDVTWGTQAECKYTEVLKEIHAMTLPIFQTIKKLAIEAGYQDVELFQAWPKGLCENFVFIVKDGENPQSVILAKNKKYHFWQNGGGKTKENETSLDGAYREAQEEFSFKGNASQIKRLTIESESGFPIFHFVKGVYVIEISKEQASELKLADDMAKNEIIDIPLQEFIDKTYADRAPIDHAYDRQWIAKYLSASDRDTNFDERVITTEDYHVAKKAVEWMRNVKVHTNDLHLLKEEIKTFLLSLNSCKFSGNGPWKIPENRDCVKKAAQKVVDAIVKRIIPAWTYQGKNGFQEGCQVKVQEAVGVLVNGEPLPAFLTIPQMVAAQKLQSFQSNQFVIVDMSNQGYERNVITNFI